MRVSSKNEGVSRFASVDKRVVKRSALPAKASTLTAVAIAVGLSCQASQAATLIVNSTTDALLADSIGGNCTFREAVSSVVTGSTTVNGGDTGCNSFGPAFGTNDRIEFAAGIDGQTISLRFGPGGVGLSRSVEINRNDRDITIDMSGNSSGFSISNPGTEVILNNLTLTGGSSPDGAYGGSILAINGPLVTITNSNITGNTAGAAGAIFATGDGTQLRIENSSITSNSSRLTGTGSNFGGGVLVFSGASATIEDSIISNNIGGFGAGFSAGGNAGAIVIRNTTISNNTAVTVGSTPNGSGQGGGIGVIDTPSVRIENSTISGNTAAFGSAVVFGLTVSARIENSTISDNFATTVTGIEVGTDVNLTIASSTIASNRVTADGSIGGIVVRDDATVRFENSILADSSFADCFVSENGNFSSDSNSIIQNPNNDTFSCASNARVSINPVLAPLRNNGGRTMTHALLAGSPAIDTGGNCLALDQRGFSRPRVGCDVGAFEFPPPPPPPPPPGSITPQLLLLLLDEEE